MGPVGACFETSLEPASFVETAISLAWAGVGTAAASRRARTNTGMVGFGRGAFVAVAVGGFPESGPFGTL